MRVSTGIWLGPALTYSLSLWLFSVACAYSKSLTPSGFWYAAGTAALAGSFLRLTTSTFTNRYLVPGATMSLVVPLETGMRTVES